MPPVVRSAMRAGWRGGVLFIPAILVEEAISSAEFTNLQDAFNFELNQQGKNGAEFEGGWTAAEYAALAKWVDAHPEILKMPRTEFDALLTKATQPQPARGNPSP
jgi:4-hydroxy-4-methyl-2-oxoglutarate aldolase